MLLVSEREVEELLDLDDLIDALAGAMADLSSGRASVPNRIAARVDEREGLLAAMPGYAPSAGALASKLVTLFPHNADTGLPAHQAVIAVFDPDNGTPLRSSTEPRSRRSERARVPLSLPGCWHAMTLRRSRSSARASRAAHTHAQLREFGLLENCASAGVTV
jgi:hypothetical protein